MKTKLTKTGLGACLAFVLGTLLAQAQDASTELVLWLKFDESSGNVASDSSGFGNNCTFTTGDPVTWYPGVLGNCIGLDGTDRGTIPNSPSIDIAGTNLTVAGWINCTPNGTMMVYEKPYNTNDVLNNKDTAPYFAIGIEQDSGRVDLTVGEPGGGYPAQKYSTRFVPSGNTDWFHFAVVYDGTFVRFYVNGTLLSREPYTAPIQARGLRALVGNTDDLTEPYTGLIDDLRVYDRTLTPQDVYLLANGTVSTAPAGDIVAPANGTVITPGSDLVLAANMSASTNRTISQVQFFHEASPIGTVTSSPWTLTWSNVPAAFYTLTAVATDNNGQSGTSGPVDLNAQVPTNVLWLKFDETTGDTAADSSGNGNNGTFSTTPVWATGVSNGAVAFDGLSVVLDIPASPSLDIGGNPSQITIAGWVNPYSIVNCTLVDEPFNSMDVVQQEFASPYYQYGLEVNGDASLQFYFADQNANLQTKQSPPGLLQPGVWTHIAVVYDGSAITYYTNAVLVKSLSQTGQFNPRGNRLRIGGDDAMQNLYAGLMDDLRLYDQALRQIDVRSLISAATNPLVYITAPVDYIAFGNPATFTVIAHAEAISGRAVTNVAFYSGATLIGSATNSPFSATVTLSTSNPNGVTNLITAVATDDSGSTSTSPPIHVVIAPPPPLPNIPLQFAGDVVASLSQADLVNNPTATWPNRSLSPLSVGDFHSFNGASLQLSTAYPWNTYSVTALAVNNTTANAVVSALYVPDEMTNNGASSAEVWTYCPNYGAPNSDVIAYGIQGGPSAPKEDREMCADGSPTSKAWSFNFGGSDLTWQNEPSLGAWHYLVWTYDGATASTYVDGVPDISHGNVISTVGTVVVVGAGNAGGATDGSALTGPFAGYIASARLSTGVLTLDQITNNYAAGIFAGIPAFKLTTGLTNGLVTLTWPSSGLLLQAPSVLGPWTTNAAATSPFVFRPQTNGPTQFYRLQYIQN